jgi:hypothetical protein
MQPSGDAETQEPEEAGVGGGAAWSGAPDATGRVPPAARGSTGWKHWPQKSPPAAFSAPQ